MRIRLRLALLFALGTAALISVGGWMYVRVQADDLRGSATAALWVRADTVAESLARASGDGATYQGWLKGVAAWNEQDEVYQIITPRGDLLDGAGPVHAVLLDASLIHQAQQHSQLLERQVMPAEPPWLLLATPLPGTGGEVQVTGTSIRPVDAALAHTEPGLDLGGPLGVVLAGLAAWVLAGAALRPVERMRRQAAEVSVHDPHATLEVPRTRDELAALARTLTGMLGR